LQINSKKMILTDTHTHLYATEFDEDRDEMIQRAIDAGVTRFFLPSIDSSFTQSMYDLEQSYPENIFLMMGLHPTHVNENYLEELQHVKQELARRKFVAIGEIGIDLYWDKTFLSQQQEAFSIQIQLAKKYKIPVIIHCRDAFEEIFAIVEQEKSPDLFGIFHCFSGTHEQAVRTISYGMKLGIGGVATFKNGKIDQYLNKIDLEHIVLETDSPYLAPVPYRGKRNESSYLVTILDKLSKLYNRPKQEIAQITTANSKVIFGI
jgi:TatD DNase family protein